MLSLLHFWHLCEETNHSALRSALETCLLTYVVELPEKKTKKRNHKNEAHETTEMIWHMSSCRTKFTQGLLLVVKQVKNMHITSPSHLLTKFGQNYWQQIWKKKDLHCMMCLHLRAAVATPVTVGTRCYSSWGENIKLLHGYNISKMFKWKALY